MAKRRKPSLRVVEAIPIRQGNAPPTRLVLWFSLIIIACSFLLPVALASFQFQLRHCKRALVLANANHDHFLNRHVEYVSFLNQYSAKGFQSTALPVPLQKHFDQFKGENDQIDILGVTQQQQQQQQTDSFLDENAAPRERFLEAFCNGAAEIITLLADSSTGSSAGITLLNNSASNPSSANSHQNPSLRGGIPGVAHHPVPMEKESNRKLQSLQKDNDPSPNIFLGRQRRADSVTIRNAWQVSNSFGFTANLIMSSPDWEGLEDAYVAFVTDIVSELSNETTTSTNRNLRRRTVRQSHPRRILLVSFDPQSAELVDMVDSDCPLSALQKASCQIVYGRFDLVTDENVDVVYQRYANATQAAIQNGRLQQHLDELDAGNELYIERSVDLQENPITSPAAATESDTRVDNEDDFDESDDGLGLLGFLLIFGACTIVVVAIIAAMTLPKRDDRIIQEKKPAAWSGSEGGDEEDSPDDKSKNKKFREQVEALVEKNCPQEKENIDAMIQQFAGREEELIKKLQSMSPLNESLVSADDAQQEIVFSMGDNSKSTQDQREEEDSIASETTNSQGNSLNMENETDSFVSEASESQDGSASKQSQEAGSDQDGSFVSEGSGEKSFTPEKGHESCEPEGFYMSADKGLDEASASEVIPESERATSLEDTGKKIHVNDLHNLLGHPSEDTTRNTGKYYGLIVVGVFAECAFCEMGHTRQKTIPKTWDPQSDEPDYSLFNLPRDSLKCGDQDMQSGDSKEGSFLQDQVDNISEPEDSSVSDDEDMGEASASEVIPESERATSLQDMGKKIHVNDLHNLLGHPSEDTTRKTGKYYGLTVVGVFTACDFCKLETARQKTIPKIWDPQSDEPDYSLFNLSRVSLNSGNLDIQSQDGKAEGSRSIQETPRSSTSVKEDERFQKSKEIEAFRGQEGASSSPKSPVVWNGGKEKQRREAVGRDSDVSESHTEEGLVLHGGHEEDSTVSEASVPQEGAQKKHSHEPNKDSDSFVSEPLTGQDESQQRGLDADSSVSDSETQKKQLRRINDQDDSFVSESSTEQGQSPKEGLDNDFVFDGNNNVSEPPTGQDQGQQRAGLDDDLDEDSSVSDSEPQKKQHHIIDDQDGSVISQSSTEQDQSPVQGLDNNSVSGRSRRAQSGAQADPYESFEDNSFVTEPSLQQNGGDRVGETSESKTDKSLCSGAIKTGVEESTEQKIYSGEGYPNTSAAAANEGSLSQYVKDELDKLRCLAAEKSKARRRAEEEARLADEARSLAEEQARVAIEARLKAEEAILNVTPPLPVESEQPIMQRTENQVVTILSDGYKDLKEESETSEQFLQEAQSELVDLHQQVAPSLWNDHESAISWDAVTEPIDISGQEVPSGFDGRQQMIPSDVTAGTENIESILKRGAPHKWVKDSEDWVLEPTERVDQNQLEHDRKRKVRSIWEKVRGQWVSREVFDIEGEDSSSSEYCSSSESSSEYYRSEDEDAPASLSEYYSSEDEEAPGSHWMKEGWKEDEKKRRYEPKI